MKEILDKIKFNKSKGISLTYHDLIELFDYCEKNNISEEEAQILIDNYYE